jgi:hypothetical protein
MEFSFHTDNYSTIYLLNVINHLTFESEVIKLFYDDPKDGKSWPPPETYTSRARLSEVLRNINSGFGTARYEF